jgi:predicted AlkP superfamily pyrophosphatase or phosphodiesterase
MPALLLALALLLAPVWAVAAVPAPGAPPAPPARHVVVLSLDGARADALRAAMPASLVARSAASWTAQTVRPSLTLPAHASMLSGLIPAVHGVTFNDWRPGGPPFRYPTVFTAVAAAGGRAAAFVHKQKLMMLVPGGEAFHARWLAYPRFRQTAVVEAAARYLAEQRPAFLFVHVADPDDRGHARGWMSEEYLAVIAAAPSLMERMLRAFDDAGVATAALLIVTADHGGHDRTHGTSRPEDMTIPWLALGGAAQAGAVLGQVMVYDTAPTVLAALGLPVPPDWQGRAVTEALRPR